MTSYSEDWCFELCKRWNTISVQWQESSSFNDLLQQKHDSRWNQLSHLWQEIASHYSMLRTLTIQIEMHWTTHSDVHWSSDFEDLHEKQTVESMTSQLSEHSIKVQLSDHL